MAGWRSNLDGQRQAGTKHAPMGRRSPHGSLSHRRTCLRLRLPASIERQGRTLDVEHPDAPGHQRAQ